MNRLMMATAVMVTFGLSLTAGTVGAVTVATDSFEATPIALTSDVWSEGAADKMTQKDYGTGEAPTGAGEKYVNIDTDGGTVSRGFVAGTDPTVDLSEGPVFVDTYVKFTATEEAPAIGTDAKLALWLKETPAEGETPASYQLMLACGKIDEGGQVTTVNVELDAAVDTSKMYRVTVKPLVAMTDYELTAFEIYIDGVVVAKKAGDPLVHEDVASYLTAKAKGLLDSGKLFPSTLGMVAEGEGGYTLSSVGFQGTGDIDLVTVTDEDPIPPAVVDPTTEDALILKIANAASGDTIKLGGNITLTAPLAINKSITIDLNGKTLAYDGEGWAVRYGDTVTGEAVISNGVITSTCFGVRVNQYDLTLDGVTITSAKRALQSTTASDIILKNSAITINGTADEVSILAKGGTFDMVNASLTTYVKGLELDGVDASIDADSVITEYGACAAIFVGSEESVKTTLDLAGQVTCSGVYAAEGDSPYAISGNGTDHVGADVTITAGATITAANSETAIYWPQAGTLTVDGGSITGGTAIWAKSGVIDINGGTFTGKATKVSLAESNNGVTATGDAIVLEKLDPSTGYANNLSCTIDGGTFVSDNAAAVNSYAREGQTALAAFISAGEFKGETLSTDLIAGTAETGYQKAWVAGTTQGYVTPGAEAITYTITYEYAGLTDAPEVTNPNPASYTIESETITLADASCEGYTFKGWDTTSIAKGSTGDKTITGTFEKSAPAVDPVVPGEEPTECKDAETATNTVNYINANKATMITVPTGVAEGADTATFLSKVEAKVIEGTKVAVVMTPAAAVAAQEEVDAAVKADTVAPALTSTDTTVKATLTGTVPGFYYWIDGGTEVGTVTTHGNGVLGGGEIELTKPDLGTTTKAFFKVSVGLQAPVPPNAD